MDKEVRIYATPLDHLISKIKEQHGFLFKENLKEMAELNRLKSVLVRCGGGRFLCPAQDAQHFIEIITKEGSDYVRDVSLTP